jgi:hypothetical protein
VGLFVLDLPVLLFLEITVPRGECILPKVGEVRWVIIVFCTNNLGLIAQEALQRDETKMLVKILCIRQ